MADMHCGTCGATVPQTAWPDHRCPPLTGKQLRKSHTGRRAFEASVAAITPRSRPCDDCGGTMVPGEWHSCPGRPRDAALAAAEAFRRADQVAPIAAELQRQGWTPPAPPTPPVVLHELPEGAEVSPTTAPIVDLDERRFLGRLRRR